jgi:hypothetical protein
MSHEQTLESLVARYRRAAAAPALARAEIELEVRFRGVDFHIFETVLRALVAKEIAVDAGTVTHTVNAIMGEDPATRRPRHRAGAYGRRANLIRQLTFDSSSAEGRKVGERYYRKWPLVAPFRVRNPHALDYNVVLSAEEGLPGSFTSDAGALIRVKSRASFVHASWRIDLTVTRALRGSDAQTALPGVVAKMFRAGAATPANMLEILDLADPDSEYRGLYNYELELEHLPGGEGAAEDLRPAEVTALVGRVLRLINATYMEEAVYQAEIFHVAGFVVDAPGLLRRFEHEWGLKRLAPQVVALTRGEYKAIYPPTGFMVLDKADGVRALASVRDGRLLVLADDLLTFHAPEASDAARVARPTIVDGELVRGGGRRPVFHAFDVIAILGENVSGAGYEARVGHLADAVGILRDFGLDARPKPVVHITASEPAELKAQFLSPVFERRPYGTDGRILVEPGKPYRSTLAYKWKSLWDTTIDFLARRAPPSALGRRPFADAPGHKLHFLFVGINPDLFDALGLERLPGYRELFGGRYSSGSYFPIQFSPSDAPLAYLYQHPDEKPVGASGAARGWEGWAREIDGKVIELRCAGEGGACAAAGFLGSPAWQLVRVREDRAREIRTQRYFGNDFRIAELTWLNYVDPFEEAQLWEGAALGYFAAPKSAMYRAQTAFTSFVKSRRIESALPHAQWVVDAAIGKGQDFGRYVKAGVRHVVGIDIDQSALSELVRRKFSHAGHGRKKARRGRGRKRHGPTTLFALRADLTSPHEEVAAKVRTIVGFPAAGADALVSNLAIHYFAGDVVHIRNFAALCRGLVKVGGTVIITTMFGQKVHDLLSSEHVGTGESWDSRRDGVLKYSIRRDYAEPRLTTVGQRIGVLLPFSNGEYYEEFLVNVDSLVEEFAARGFAATATPSFDAFFDDFRTRNPTMSKMLTPADFEFLGLYGEIVFRRES